MKSKKENLILIILFAFAIACGVANAQIRLQDSNRYSLQLSTDNVIFQKEIFYGGIEFQAEFCNGVYIRPQIHYADLKDGYLEISSGIGSNLTYNKWNYKSGIKLGVINRASTYPIFGIEAIIEYHITDKIGIGIRGSYDARGDSDFYEGNPWVWNSQGYIKFVL